MLEFDCPVLGYRCLAIPVFCRDNVIAVAYVGEICLKKKLTFLRKLHEDQRERLGSCGDNLVELYDVWVQKDQHVLSDKKYEELLSASLKEIQELESTLLNELALLAQNHIRERVNKYISDFHHGLSVYNSNPSDGLRDLWHIVEGRLEEIRRDFCIQNICVFGTYSHSVAPFPDRLNLVCAVGDISSILTRPRERVTFRLDKFTELEHQHLGISPRKPELLKCISGAAELDGKCDFVRSFPIRFSPYRLAVTWARYDSTKWNPLSNPYDKEAGKQLDLIQV